MEAKTRNHGIPFLLWRFRKFLKDFLLRYGFWLILLRGVNRTSFTMKQNLGWAVS